MRMKTLGRWLVVGIFACVGLAMGASAFAEETVVQNGNESTDASATSAPVTAGNTTTASSGPSARDGGRAAMVGDTNTSVNQDATAEGSPVYAGSQVSSGRRGGVEQNSNSSSGASASGDPVFALNNADVHNGPLAQGDGADASMVGDGELDVSQDAFALGGPASAGSQFTDSDGIVQNVNSCGDAVVGCGEAIAGGVVSQNVFGDSADEFGFDDSGVPSGVGPIAVQNGDTGDAVTAKQVGDTDAVITQSARGVSGSAHVGSQETHGGETVQNGNETTNGTAESGPVTSFNFGASFVGAFASASSTAHAAHVGDAAGDLDMLSDARSGNAVTGSQVTGTVGDKAGALNVQNQSASEDDDSFTGEAHAGSAVTAFAGPNAVAVSDGDEADASARLVGDAEFDIVTRATARSGDAGAGSQFTNGSGGVVQNDNTSIGAEGVIEAESGEACASFVCAIDEEIGGNVITASAGPSAFSNPAPATASQVGDAELEIDADATALTGGAQKGVQASETSGSATIQNSNLSDGDQSTSGRSLAGNLLDANAGGLAVAFDTPADVVLAGDAELEADLVSSSISGDAVTGTQLATASGDGVIQDTNSSFDNTSTSGDALSGNDVTLVSGPSAIDVPLDVLSTGDAVRGVLAEGLSAKQVGDSRIDAEFLATASSGDAMTGSQDEISNGGTIQNENTASSSEATSAPACAAPSCGASGVEILVPGEPGEDPVPTTVDVVGGNVVEIYAGAAAAGDGGSSSLAGDATADVDLRVSAESLNATAGSQLSRASGNANVQNLNEADTALAGCIDGPESCIVVASNTTLAYVGPFASLTDTGNAVADMVGDAELDATQDTRGIGGATSAGAQVTDASGGATVQNENLTEATSATAGPVVAINALGVEPDLTPLPVVVGPASLSDARAVHVGDAELESDQRMTVGSGDAVSGVQLTGTSGQDVQQQNVAGPLDSLASSGAAAGFNTAGGFVAALADEGADVASVGDRILEIDQEGDVFTAIAVASSQVTLDNGDQLEFLGEGFTAFSTGEPFGSADADDDFTWSTGGFIGDSLGAAVA